MSISFKQFALARYLSIVHVEKWDWAVFKVRWKQKGTTDSSGPQRSTSHLC